MQRTLGNPGTLLKSQTPLALHTLCTMSSPTSAKGKHTPAAPSLVDKVKLGPVRGMKTLDKEAFKVTYPILSLRVDNKKMGKVRSDPILRGFLMDMPKTRQILDDPQASSTKLLRLRVQKEDELPAAVREFIAAQGRGLVQDQIVYDYDAWTASDILNSILPEVDNSNFAPSSFTQTGHIGHVNLKEEWLPYKNLIGQVFLDKNPKLRTIVNKLDSIHAQFRYFDMEVLAGEPDFITTCSESNCLFTFDFSKVYWNSRLQHEHDRLVDLLPPGNVVADAMAGVGPFAVPAAKKGCFVLGNDLNPESVKWMRENRVANKVEGTLRVTEIDGAEFIKQSARMSWDKPFPPWISPAERRKRAAAARRERDARKKLTLLSLDPSSSSPSPSTTQQQDATHDSPSEETPENEVKLEPQLPQHYLMNLPDSALTFLGAFQGVFSDVASEPGFEQILQASGLPMVHVYCFTRELEFEPAQKDICERATEYLGHPVEPTLDSFNLHLVRRVAPNKDMYCLSFRLPRTVALAPRNSQ